MKFAAAVSASVDPKDVRPYVGLGYIYFMQKRYAEAAVAYKRALQVQPALLDLHFNLGLTYLRLNRKDEALKEKEILERLNSKLAERLERSLGRK